MDVVSEVLEVPVPIPERMEGEGVIASGMQGDADPSSMVDRARRVKNFQKRLDYRECVPCDRCGNCLEMRRFTKKHEERMIALYCLMGEFETNSYCTCNYGRRMKGRRKKVVYYLENAPAGMKLVAEKIAAEVPMYEAGSEIATTMDARRSEYRGGSEYYKRVEGKEVVETGTVRMPKKLIN